MQVEILQSAIYRLERISLQAAKEERGFIKFNYAKKIDEKILRYLPILYKYLEVFLLGEKSCITEFGCYDRIKQMIGEINRKTVFNERLERADLKITKKDNWEIQHPDCISYERWNKLSYIVCSSLGITVSIEKKMCDITYSLAKEIINCETFAAISVYNKACNLGYKVNTEEIQCKTEYKLLIDKYPKCDLTYKLYKELKKCDMTYDIVETIVCQGNNSVEVIDGEVIMHNVLGNINLNKDLYVQNIIEPERIASTMCHIRGTKRLSDREFMELLASDYNLNKENKEILLKTLI